VQVECSGQKKSSDRSSRGLCPTALADEPALNSMIPLRALVCL
jgi:hypothetical protein